MRSFGFPVNSAFSVQSCVHLTVSSYVRPAELRLCGGDDAKIFLTLLAGKENGDA